MSTRHFWIRDRGFTRAGRSRRCLLAYPNCTGSRSRCSWRSTELDRSSEVGLDGKRGVAIELGIPHAKGRPGSMIRVHCGREARQLWRGKSGDRTNWEHTLGARCSTGHYFCQRVRSTTPACSRLPRSTGSGSFHVEWGGSRRIGGRSPRIHSAASRRGILLEDEGLNLEQRRDRRRRKSREFRRDHGRGPLGMGIERMMGWDKPRRSLLYAAS